MTEALAFSLNLEHVQGYEFRLKFDWPNLPDLTLDEPAPLGQQHGPNASRLLAAAVANCLSASLLFCLSKAHAAPRGMRTAVTGRLARNDTGRLRIDGLEVAITLDDALETPARFERCAGLFEDYCVVTQSVRQGIPVRVKIFNRAGDTLFQD
ncbi:MAG TPA: OsmC family protein [Albitalea sp.]|nr:OsmC family protein [Albitalea sp.]